MMRFTVVCAAFIAAMFVISSAYAEEESSKTEGTVEENTFEYYAKQPTGVCKIEFDEEGNIKYMVVVANTRISTTFGKAKGKEIAARKAMNLCDGEVVKALKRTVKVNTDTNENPIQTSVGEQTEGKMEEIDPVQIQIMSEGILRGMITLGNKIKTEDGESTYVLVRVYDRTHTKGIKKAYNELNTDEIEDEPKSRDNSGKRSSNSKSAKKKTFKNETHISPSASKYLK